MIAFFASVYLVGSLLSAPRRAVIHLRSELGAENVRFKSESGVELAGSWINGRPEMPVIILMHGVRANRLATEKRALLFKELGNSVFLFDFQAHGESEGDHITFGALESSDAHSAVQYVRTRRPTARIGVIAISMGGAAALLGTSPIDADALVLESVYPDIRTAIDNRIRRWLGPIADVLTPLFIAQLEFRLHIPESDLRPIDRITQLHVPVLILSGAGDMQTTEADSKALFESARDPKQLIFFEGAGHVDLLNYDPAKYRAAVTEFFDHNLLPEN